MRFLRTISFFFIIFEAQNTKTTYEKNINNCNVGCHGAMLQRL